MLRSAGVAPPRFKVPSRCDEWFVFLANELAPYAHAPAPERALNEIATEAADKVFAALAPAILAMISPQSKIADCAAAELPAYCKREIRKLLPGFCARVLAQWEDEALPVGRVFTEDDSQLGRLS
jgi:hypothetical protein